MRGPAPEGPPLPGGRRALTRRILAFAGVPFVSLIAPFLFLPVLARIAGEDAWVAIALGTSAGAFAALVAGLGYPTLAPPQVAVADAHGRRRYLATSLHARLPLWCAAAAVALLVAVLLAPPSHGVDAGLMALASSLAGLAPTWHWIGVGRVAPMLWSEVLPRLAATVAAAGILLAGGPVVWYPALLLAVAILGPAVVYWLVAGRELLVVDAAAVGRIYREHPPAVIAESAAGAYNALAVTFVTAVAPVAAAASYVSGDRAYRVGQYAVSALGNALQGWTVEAGAGSVPRRLRVVVALHAGLGVLGLLAFGLLGPWLTALLFGETVAIDALTAWGFGVATLGVSLGTAFGRIGLIVHGARHAFMVCVLIAAGIGVTGLIVGAAIFGAAGAAWGLGIAEACSAVLQGVVLLVTMRARRASSPEGRADRLEHRKELR